MGKVKGSIRQNYIDIIMKKKYGDDNLDSKNQAFLESLTLSELSCLANDDEDEFDVEGEIKFSDFDEEELG